MTDSDYTKHLRKCTKNFVKEVRRIAIAQPIVKGYPVQNEKDVCDLLGIHQASFSPMKQGRRNVTLRHIIELHKVFKVPYENVL